MFNFYPSLTPNYDVCNDSMSWYWLYNWEISCSFSWAFIVLYAVHCTLYTVHERSWIFLSSLALKTGSVPTYISFSNGKQGQSGWSLGVHCPTYLGPLWWLKFRSLIFCDWLKWWTHFKVFSLQKLKNILPLRTSVPKYPSWIPLALLSPTASNWKLLCWSIGGPASALEEYLGLNSWWENPVLNCEALPRFLDQSLLYQFLHLGDLLLVSGRELTVLPTILVRVWFHQNIV